MPPPYVFVLFILAFMIAPGCVPIPVVADLPFSEEALEFIQPGETDRATIESRLGNPSTERVESSISLYHTFRSIALLVAPAGLGELSSEHVLVVYYDSDDVVQGYEILRLGTDFLPQNEVCTTDMLCIVYSSGGLIVFDRPESDSRAKLFEIEPEQCSIYVYATRSGPGQGYAKLCTVQGDACQYSLGDTGYLYWKAQPGVISISADSGWETSGRWLVTHTFECDAGGEYFLNLRLRHHVWGDPSVSITTDNSATGRESVSSRRLVLR
jgi:hypothetical protein